VLHCRNFGEFISARFHRYWKDGIGHSTQPSASAVFVLPSSDQPLIGCRKDTRFGPTTGASTMEPCPDRRCSSADFVRCCLISVRHCQQSSYYSYRECIVYIDGQPMHGASLYKALQIPRSYTASAAVLRSLLILAGTREIPFDDGSS